jgi:uncharacterized membrane protein YkgB
VSNFLNKINLPLARFAIFLVYFWFGLLKVIGESPASSLVKSLFNQTIAQYTDVVTFSQFFILFGLFEMLIGILFLIPKLEKFAFPLLILHLITTAMPMVLLSKMVWTKPWVPALEGQYILKNILILSLGINVFVHRR